LRGRRATIDAYLYANAIARLGMTQEEITDLQDSLSAVAAGGRPAEEKPPAANQPAEISTKEMQQMIVLIHRAVGDWNAAMDACDEYDLSELRTMLLVERHQWGRAMAGAMPIPARTSGLIRRNPIHLRFLNSSQSKTNSVSDDTADPRSWHSAIKPIYVYDTQVEQQIQRGLLARFCGDQKVMDAAIGALRESRDSPVALRAAMGLVAMEVPADRLKNTAGNHSASYAQLLAHAGHPERALRALGARSMSPGQFVFQCLGKWGDDAFLHGGVGPRRLATTMRLLDHVGAAGHSESLLAAALASPTKQPNATKSRDNSYRRERDHGAGPGCRS
ncbi:MAG: hypothetical protein AAFP69_24250, partial [Planctomycetota bacterium]